MLGIDLARRIRDAGVLWQPAPGDRFVIDRPELLAEVYWISDLTIDVHTHFGAPVLGFNGTVEWALDSVSLDHALWLPREEQLRALLGDRFASLERLGAQWRVRTTDPPSESVARDAEDAYALALLAVCEP